MAHRTWGRAAVAVAAVASMAAIATPAASADVTAQAWYFNHYAYPDDGDSGGTSIYVSAYDGTSSVSAYFAAKGENITLRDYHDNDRPAIAKIWVGGSGPAVFYADGDNTDTFINESYDENQTVYLQVCTSDSANAVCTTKSKGKGRT
ncbi:hypothetical protein [Amycolatopsis sp. YIM 10]|uniref:hypothetical protein n=1 Tax=Amycolatopsis sp. YIM 10 TaxID=2653857 RepID=UPI00128FEEC4|nr:hypothetical protein [Amycolatopsis sp. YIM 10]QFU90398.1 hypothetical protein YIM_26120 [Amycolatopsis sp. YIM 10]